MPAKPTKVPSYCRHKATGQAVVRLNGRDHYLGPYGTAESQERYARLIAQWQATGAAATAASERLGSWSTAAPLSVNEVLLAYLEYARGYYTKDGEPNQEFESLKYAMRPLKQLYGHSRAADFGPKDLKTVRQRMIDDGLSRTYINNQTNRIKRIFKWAVSEELVPPSVYHGLQTVAGLRFGRSAARETTSVRPVADCHVDAILPFVAPPVAAMIRLQRLTGMRSGEVVIMRACDIDMSGEVWLYAPSDHKNKWRGQCKVIPLGPRAQNLVKPFLKLDTEAFLFSPRDADGWHRQQRMSKSGAGRTTPLYPSERRRREKLRQLRATRKRRRPARHRYDTASYRRAIEYGIKRAQKAGFDVPDWHPHQLRHSKATEVRREFGLEAAQVTLGHASAEITQVYAERNLRLAINIAARTG
jgi:integrase